MLQIRKEEIRLCALVGYNDIHEHESLINSVSKADSDRRGWVWCALIYRQVIKHEWYPLLRHNEMWQLCAQSLTASQVSGPC